MGGDAAIVQAARVSYGGGTKTQREDAGLIRYLVKNRHTTPLEMVQFKFHVKLPIFVARQWIRHRMGTFNEVSARYSVLPAEFYIPEVEHITTQDTKNRQGRGLEQVADAKYAREIFLRQSIDSYHEYELLLDLGVARELSRMVLPLNIYTEWYWKVDLHNLMGFLGLRLDPHAQWEMRQYAQALLELARPVAPVAFAAWEERNAASAV
jgi:thymidylate synthase (FAD)